MNTCGITANETSINYRLKDKEENSGNSRKKKVNSVSETKPSLHLKLEIGS